MTTTINGIRNRLEYAAGGIISNGTPPPPIDLGAVDDLELLRALHLRGDDDASFRFPIGELVDDAPVLRPEWVAFYTRNLELFDDLDEVERSEALTDLEGLALRLELETSVAVDELGDPFNRAAARTPISRSYLVAELGELTIDRSDKSGRVVRAYAAPFDQEAEIFDAEGHYWETISSTAFNRQLSRDGAADAITVLYNHGRDTYGNPVAEFSKPIGTPLEIKADKVGLFTRTRYADTPLGNEMLQLVRDKALRHYSITATVTPGGKGTRRTRRGHSSGLDLVERHDLNLIEYGPTPLPAYTGAAVIGVRARMIAQNIAELTASERLELGELLRSRSTGSSVEPPPDRGSASVAVSTLQRRHEQNRRRHENRG